ncbi:adenylylsulfate kinase [Salinimicrobium catena]|uniref:Adenylyl-sulfate kinase n=1 Tax=Salinimicrobium catena TaxID=390640 RepID=A0A1H5LJL9_9FLAO|nr:adenylyl-sulfate kinase [Salinimicrobium catena]SDL10752.1 adenylylsulfate kinase [Salinimicrobium catena]SEE77210.1 adenylylsulfate kinase [Salinimicrobium catena]
MKNIIKHTYHVSREDRNSQNGHNSFVIWFTGLSGSGKSTIANQLEKKLFDLGVKTYSLDGDNIRSGLNKGLSFTEEDRTENNRRIAEVAKLFMDAGLVTITAFISPLAEDREKAKEVIGDEDFIEVFVNTPLEVCEERDVKGLYKKARQGEIKNFTGISSPYEAPVNPDIEIKTENESIEESVERIFQVLKGKLAYNE